MLGFLQYCTATRTRSHTAEAAAPKALNSVPEVLLGAEMGREMDLA